MPIARRVAFAGTILAIVGAASVYASTRPAAASPVTSPVGPRPPKTSVQSASDPDDNAHSTVTVYGAVWCGFCKALEATLADRKIPFEKVDVDQDPSRYNWAKKEAGGMAGIPLTGVYRKTNGASWFVGNVPDAIEKAYRSE